MNRGEERKGIFLKCACVVITIVMAFAFPSVGTSKQKKSKKTKLELTAIRLPGALTHDDSVRYRYFLLEAERQQVLEHYAAAFDLMEHCKQLHPNGAEAWFMQSLYYKSLDRDSMTLECLKKAVALNPSNKHYLERLAQMYVETNDYDNAKAVYEDLVERDHSRTDVLNTLVQLYQKDRQYDKMLWVIERMEALEGVSEELTLAKLQVYERKDDMKSAYKALKSLSDEYPNDLNYKVMMGNWLMKKNRRKEAFKIFSKALKEDPNNSYVLSSIYDYYREVGEDTLAHRMMETILGNKKTETSLKVTMLRQVIQDNERDGGDSTKVLSVFDRVMKVNPQDADMAEMKAAYMVLKDFPTDSINAALCQVLAIAPDNAGARLQILQNLWPEKRWDEIIEFCKPAVQYNPDEMAFYYFMGLAYYQKDDKESALDAFRRGVGEITPQSNKDIVSDFYALMGDILHEKNLVDEAFAAYDSCLQWKDDNVGALNNYAYYLSLRGEDLHRAEQMSYKTVKTEPQNATYLDTYAWILYMQERYEEARIYIDQAVKNDTDTVQNSVILEHAGDIYHRLGDKAKALEYWQRALDAGAEENADDIRRKMSENGVVKKDDE